MAGHSQFKNIMHRKGAQDEKRAKLFTKLLREITVSARAGGIDPDMNPRLRMALAHARQANMPKDNIERALKKSTGEGENYESLRYEGYGPEGVAIIVETLTDNRNRTSAEVRALFNKHGGSLGETNSVSFMFQHVGAIVYDLKEQRADQHEVLMLKAMEEGALDILTEDHYLQILCPRDSFMAVKDALEEAFGPPCLARLIWNPGTLITIADAEKQEKLAHFLGLLEDQDDAQAVWCNAEGFLSLTPEDVGDA